MKRSGIPPLTTWHGQQGLLFLSFAWGLSYIVPADRQPRFAGVLGQGPIPMWGWGLALIVAALVAYGTKVRSAYKSSSWLWPANYGAHMVLAGIYAAQATASMIDTLNDINEPPTSMFFWGNIVSTISRGLLWGFIAYMHSTYARLPRPVRAEVEE